jgi:thiamine pyrophosphate-dependent acetolactate synthase large subunit-like protein
MFVKERHMTPNRLNAKRPFSLGDRWLTYLSKTSYGPRQRPLTDKECRQLKDLANALGSLTNEVLEWSLENWRVFALSAERAAGLTCSPEKPSIPFLLAHCQDALDGMRKAAEKAARRTGEKKWFAEIAEAQERARREKERAREEEAPYRSSPAELFAILKELEKG